eukprot:6607521-Prymnesium_polylepis.1
MDRRGPGRHPHSESECVPPLCRSRVSHACHVRVPRPRSPLMCASFARPRTRALFASAAP